MFSTSDKKTALSEYEERGGAMSHETGLNTVIRDGRSYQENTTTYFIGSVEEIGEMVAPVAAKDATEAALCAAGCSDEKVKKIMSEWQDATETT